MNDDIPQLWPLDVLTRIGFHPRDAARLHSVLPPILTRTLTAHLEEEPDERPSRYYNPAATVVWLLLSDDIRMDVSEDRSDQGDAATDCVLRS